MKKTHLIALATAATLPVLAFVAYCLMPDAAPDTASGTIGNSGSHKTADESQRSAASDGSRKSRAATETDWVHSSGAPIPEKDEFRRTHPPEGTWPGGSAQGRSATGNAVNDAPLPDSKSANSGSTFEMERALKAGAGRAASQGMTLGASRYAVLPEGVIPDLRKPVALQNAAVTDVIPQDQAPMLGRLQDDFIAAVGGTNQNPADPEYARRWVQATSDSDAKFRQMFGQTAFLEAQQRANLQGQGGMPIGGN